MKPLVIIPARGGSKGVPGKNSKLLGGKPLLHYTIEAAKEAFPNDTICVSTDSAQIKELAEQTGLQVPFFRPSELATDTADTRSVLLHALEFYAKRGIFFDMVVLLQPTSPFRTSRHIREALSLFHPELDMVVSVKETKSNPYFTLFEENERGFLQPSKNAATTRRQDCPKVWEYNGAVYIINTESLKSKPISEFTKVVKYPMNDISSVEIDSLLDWKIAECLLPDFNLELGR